MSNELVLGIYVFIMAMFVGFEVISRVPSVLHTPLMSGTNAIHGIVVLGAMLVAVEDRVAGRSIAGGFGRYP